MQPTLRSSGLSCLKRDCYPESHFRKEFPLRGGLACLMQLTSPQLRYED